MKLGSIAYAKALAKAGVISQDESSQIIQGLLEVEKEWQEGRFEIKSGDEDIHTGKAHAIMRGERKREREINAFRSIRKCLAIVILMAIGVCGSK